MEEQLNENAEAHAAELAASLPDEPPKAKDLRKSRVLHGLEELKLHEEEGVPPDALDEPHEVDRYEISRGGKALLSKEERSRLDRNKTYEQLQEEEREKAKAKEQVAEVWGYDEQGNRVLLRDESGRELTVKEVVAPTVEEQEEEEDPMFQGVRKVAEGLKIKTEGGPADRGEVKIQLEAGGPGAPVGEQEGAGKKGKSILKGKSGSKTKASPGPKRRQLRFAAEPEGGGTEAPGSGRRAGTRGAPGESLSRSRTRGRQSQGQRGSQSRAGGPSERSSGEVAGGRGGPNSRRAQRQEEAKARRERLQAAKEGPGGSLAKKKGAKVVLDAAGDPMGTHGGEKPVQVDVARMNALAAPRNPEKYREKQAAAERERALAEGSAQGKEQKLAAKVQKSGKVDFADYIDRDVAHIRPDGQFDTGKKATEGLRAFQTRLTHKKGLFENLAKEAPAGSAAALISRAQLGGLEDLGKDGKGGTGPGGRYASV